MTRREVILQRIIAILGTAPGQMTVARNVLDVPTTQYPAAILLDGDETPPDDFGEAQQRHGGIVPILMMPLIQIVVGENYPDVGTRLNEYRAWLVPAICGDSELKTLLGPNGKVLPRGIDGTGLAVGVVSFGRHVHRFWLKTVFDPLAP